MLRGPNQYQQTPQEYPFPTVSHAQAGQVPALLEGDHPSTSKPTRLAQTLMLGNYEIERRRAQVADYNNPIDAYHSSVAIAQQQMLIEKEQEKQRRRDERRLRKALEKAHLQEHERGGQDDHRHRQRSRLPTPYASSRSVTPSADEEDKRRSGSRSKARRRDGKSKSHRNRSRRSSVSPPKDQGSQTSFVEGAYKHVMAEDTALQSLESGKHDAGAKRLAAGVNGVQSTSGTLTNDGASQYHPNIAIGEVRVLSTVNKRAERSVPSTPPDKILHDTPAIIKRVPKTVDPKVMRLEWKASSTVFTLTRSQVHCDTPNSFSQEYQRKKQGIPQGGLLKVPMPEEKCSARIFPIVSSYLAGARIIPLSEAHAILLCGKWPPTIDAYARLKSEARLYGLRRLFRRISAFLERPSRDEEDYPGGNFQLSDADRDFPLDVEDLQVLAKRRAGPRVSSPQLRVTIIGAAINFMGRKVQNGFRREPSLVLDYRMVVPTTVLSKAFKDFYYWNSEDTPEVFELSGQLTESECRATDFDITYVNSTASGEYNPGQTPPSSIYNSSLEELLRALLPIFRAEEAEAPWVYDQVFTKTAFPAVSDSPSRVGWPDTSSFYYTLNYGTVRGIFSFPTTFGELPSFTFRQLHALPENLVKH